MIKLDEILDKFQNGEQRFNEDPLFKEAITSLSYGLGVYAVLDKVLRQARTLNDLYAKTATDATALREEVQKLKDEVESYKDALQHYQR